MNGSEDKLYTELKQDGSVIHSIGAWLRDARVSLRLSEFDIAREMRLQPQYILDLEADRFDAFSSLAFVRGYLRGYARIVGIPEAELMQLFNRLALPDKQMNFPRYITEKNNLPDRRWRWMGLGVLGFVLLSLILWWQNHGTTVKTLNTSIQTTLNKVNSVEESMREAKNEKLMTQTKALAAAPMPNLGDSAALITAAQPEQNAMIQGSNPNSTVDNASAALPASTNDLSATSGDMNHPAFPNTTIAENPSTVNDLSVQTTTKPKTQASHSGLTRAHQPTIDGQAPRLGND